LLFLEREDYVRDEENLPPERLKKRKESVSGYLEEENGACHPKKKEKKKGRAK